MIQAGDFVEAARERGFTRYAGVPCSFLTPFINYVINDDALDYVSAANEGDAVAIAAGAAAGGRRAVAMMQNSGLGNAVSPLTSLTWVFRIPVLIIITHRGAPGVQDEPQHELMGKITGDMLDTMDLSWERFPAEPGDIGPALARAAESMGSRERPYGFLMSKDSVAAHALESESIPGGRLPVTPLIAAVAARPSRRAALERIRSRTDAATVLIATTGYTGRELFALGDRPNQLYMVGSMGCAPSFGLGLALARPDLRVVVIDGDGAALMRMGNFTTVGTYGAGNLVHVLLDNGVHDSTGAQATVSPNVDFAAIATSCGYGRVLGGSSLELIDRVLEAGEASGGPAFCHLRIAPGTIDHLPRPDIAPAGVLRRLMAHIGSSF